MQTSAKKCDVKCKIRKGDEVMIMTGRSKGVTGKVERIDRKAYRVFVAGANIFKKHQKPDAKSPDGGIVDKPMSLHISNVMMLDPKSGKPTRLGYKVDAEGKKVRIARASGTPL